jgi:uroporphyrinogen-III synthase
MRVLVTRPFDDAVQTAAELAARGHQSIIAPLLEIRICAGPAISLSGVQAILATSSNGVRAFSQRSDRRDIPLFAVGEHTASIARALGFSNVKSANGDTRALAATVTTWTKPKCGALMHVAGAQEPGPLATHLCARGYDVRTAMLYRAIRAARLSPESREALLAGTIDAVLLFSPNTATTFAHCVVVEGLRNSCRTLIACCISEAAAAPLKPLGLRDVLWPTHPDQTRLLSLLD